MTTTETKPTTKNSTPNDSGITENQPPTSQDLILENTLTLISELHQQTRNHQTFFSHNTQTVLQQATQVAKAFSDKETELSRNNPNLWIDHDFQDTITKTVELLLLTTLNHKFTGRTPDWLKEVEAIILFS